MSELSLAFESPGGEQIRFGWELERLRALDPAGPADPPIFRLGGELDWDQVDSVRALSGRFEDGRLIAIAAITPAGAPGHGEEAIAGLLLDGDEAAEPLEVVLLSTERGGGGELTRVGIELYRDEFAMPIRIAGEVSSRSEHRDGAIAHERAALELRCNGAGLGVFERLRAE